MDSSTLLAVLAGAVLGIGLFVAVLAVVGVPERVAGKPRRQRASFADSTQRLIRGGVVGALVLVATR